MLHTPNDTRFKKGNPGRKPGSRNKVTTAVETLLDGEAENLTRKAVELAMEGNIIALRLCLDRVSPPRKERHITLSLPVLKTAEDGPKAMGAIVTAISDGDITPSEAQSLAGMIDVYRRTLETEDLERRLAALEEKKK